MHRLSQDDVLAIYTSKLSISEIARGADLTRRTVYLIKQGKLHAKWTKSTNKTNTKTTKQVDEPELKQMSRLETLRAKRG